MIDKNIIKQKILFLKWKVFSNFFPWFKYKFSNITVNKFYSPEINRVVSDIKKNGFSVSTTKALGINNFEKNYKILEDFKTKNEDKFRIKINSKKNSKLKDNYQIDTLKYFDKLTMGVVNEILYDPIFKNISNKYFNMITKFWGMSSMLTYPSKNSPIQSQLWHKDPEDKLVFKYFILLNDVEDLNGPFMYAPGTHYYGNINKEAESFRVGNASRVKDSKMMDIIKEENWFKGVGKKGTVIFADTRGYHKGGYLLDGERWILQGCYISKRGFKEQIILNPEGG